MLRVEPLKLTAPSLPHLLHWPQPRPSARAVSSERDSQLASPSFLPEPSREPPPPCEPAPVKARFKHDKGEGESEQMPSQSTSQAQASARGGLMHASTVTVGREGGAWGGCGEGVGRGVGCEQGAAKRTWWPAAVTPSPCQARRSKKPDQCSVSGYGRNRRRAHLRAHVPLAAPPSQLPLRRACAR